MKNYDLQPIIDTLDSSITRLKELMKPSESDEFKKEYLRMTLTEFSIDSIRLKSGDDSEKLISNYVERILNNLQFKQPDNLPEPEIFEWEGRKFKIIPLPKVSKSVCSGCYFRETDCHGCPGTSNKRNYPCVINDVYYILKLVK